MSGRRSFLAGLAALAAAASPLVVRGAERLLPPPKGRRVVIVGGGWGGLAAARHLRLEAPELEVVLVERHAAFWSCPLSNKWLADLVERRTLVHDYRAAATAYGYRFLQGEVTALDRQRRRVVTADGAVDYDWLIVAAGIREDYAAWFGDDRRAAEHARQRHPSAYLGAEGAAALKAKLAAFTGGDLLMNLPPQPYRCPPAPYERASLIAWMLKSRRIKGRLLVLDPNPISPVFRRIFAEHYRDQVVYVEDARVRAVDPFAGKVQTEFDEFRFDEAILMPPQQAADLLWHADLVGRDSQGRPTGWADQEALSWQARGDERTFVIGDAMGPVSPLFGHYPKSGHMAASQGRLVARTIAARAADREPPRSLPESVCFVFPEFEPPEMLRLEARYRVRGDGVLEQATRQVSDHNPRGEDLAWAQGQFADFLALQR